MDRKLKRTQEIVNQLQKEYLASQKNSPDYYDEAKNLLIGFFENYRAYFADLSQIFLDKEFYKAVEQRKIEEFLKDDKNILRTASPPIQRLLKSYDFDSYNSPYPVLYWLFEPLCYLIENISDEEDKNKSKRVIWSAINFWDSFLKKHYAVQFLNPSYFNRKESEFFYKVVRKWMLKPSSKDHLLTLTDFLFAEKVPRKIIVIENDRIRNFRQLHGRVEQIYLEGYSDLLINLSVLRDKIKEKILKNDSKIDEILINYLNSINKKEKELVSKNFEKPLQNINIKKNSEELIKVINLFLIFDLITPGGWQFIMIYPPLLSKDTSVGGAFFVSRRTLGFPIALFLQQTLTEIFGTIESVIYRVRFLSEVLKSAIASIMSRNGSHNIGSHILSAVSNHYNDIPDDQILYKYIQDRMDYIAQITTEFPAWSYPVWFVRDLMRNFYMQHHLLNFIARSEGLSAYHYQEEKIKQNEIIIKIKRAGKQDFIIAPDTKNTSFEDDIAIAIPGGVVGNQAFYTILENIIRNSAKHNWAGQSQAEKEALKNLEITIEIDDKSERDFVIFRIWDNITNIFDDEPITEDDIRLKRLPLEGGNEKLISEDATPCYLHWSMNSKLSKSFIDQSTGQLIKANWGLAEMKISAGFLNKKDTSIIGSNEIQDILFDYSDQGYSGIIRAVPVREKIEKNGTKKGEAYRYHLGYEFAIPKPKEVLIHGQFSAITNKDEYRKHSIYFQEGDTEQNIDYEFMVLMDDGNNEFINRIKRYLTNPDENKDELYLNIKSEIERFPFRLFIVSDKLFQQLQQADITSVNPGIQFLAKRIVPLPESLFQKKLINNHQDFKLYLYAEWVRHLRQMRGLDDGQLKMLINLKGGNKHNNKQRIFRLIFDKFKNEMIDDLDDDDEIKKLLRSITTSDLDKYDGERREHKLPATYYNTDSLIDSWVVLAIYEFQIDPATGRFGFDDQKNDFKFKLRVSEAMAQRIIDSGEQLKEIAKKYYAIVKKVYVRYEEDTPTLPVIYRADSAGTAEIKLDDEINEIVNLTITSDEYQEPFDIAYNRHSSVSAAVYSESLSGAQTYFSILNHLPSDPYLKQKIALQLVENGLLRLIVIDERVAQYLTNFQYSMEEKYRTANIEIPLRIKPLEGDSESIDLIQNAEKSLPILDLENIADNKYDMMVIHQGILDKLNKNATKSQLSEFLKKVKERVPFIIITSGRGEPENIPDDAKFLAFSNIETFLLKDHPEKFLLSQIAMKITSTKRQ